MFHPYVEMVQAQTLRPACRVRADWQHSRLEFCQHGGPLDMRDAAGLGLGRSANLQSVCASARTAQAIAVNKLGSIVGVEMA
jgi:hypothetical protein